MTALQRPWASRASFITRKQYVSLAANGAVLAFSIFATIYLLKICGPIRWAESVHGFPMVWC
jgi:hypothetical protein